MYNKLFTKILDSSVWLESAHTRLVWLTLIAAMDEDGFAAFAAVGNLANRARVPVPACEKAVERLESPDPQSTDPEFEGRRIERVPGGWIILNADKYREMVTRVIARERTKERVRRHRQKARNAAVTASNVPVTPSDTYSEARSRSDTDKSVSLAPFNGAPPLLVFPTVGLGPKDWALTEPQVAAWEGAYPGVEVLAECRKALAWIMANPEKRKTAKGMARFLVSWLNRTTDRPRGGRSGPRTATEQTLAGLREDLGERVKG